FTHPESAAVCGSGPVVSVHGLRNGSASPRGGASQNEGACRRRRYRPEGTVTFMSLAFDEILRAILTSRVYEVARETSLDVAPRLSQRVDNTVWLKREDQQPVFSFKIRGAYNRIARLSQSERTAGVITASAGNHAQGVALSAKHLGIHAVIVMPKTTPDIKVAAVEALDAEVVLVGDHYSEAQ